MRVLLALVLDTLTQDMSAVPRYEGLTLDCNLTSHVISPWMPSSFQSHLDLGERPSIVCSWPYQVYPRSTLRSADCTLYLPVLATRQLHFTWTGPYSFSTATLVVREVNLRALIHLQFRHEASSAPPFARLSYSPR
ncbi:hypothetical protein J3F84DRAFT_321482 [Trichoderma pleuroticola]